MCAVAFVAGSAIAQAPVRGPIRILVGFTPGGTTDTAARLLAADVQDALGVPVLVENKPGAGGRIAAEALVHAAPDGSTLLLVPLFVPVLAPLVFKHLNYDPVTDFAPVTQVATYPIAFFVGADHPARTLPEFVAWAKANPAHADYGTVAAGSLPHFFGVMIGKASGIDMVHVPYKGIASLVTDLLSGQLGAGVDALSDVLAQHRAGKIRIIATSGTQRSKLLPTVATFREQGFADIEGDGWIGMYAPAKTPQGVLDRVSAALVASLRNRELREKLVTLGLEPTGTTAAAFADIVKRDTVRWKPIVEASGFTAD